jgi:hypothetical protein
MSDIEEHDHVSDTDYESVSDDDDDSSQRNRVFNMVGSSLNTGYNPGFLECHLFLESIYRNNIHRIVLRFKIPRNYLVRYIPVYMGRIDNGVPIDDTNEENDMSMFYSKIRNIFEEGIERMMEERRNTLTN